MYLFMALVIHRQADIPAATGGRQFSVAMTIFMSRLVRRFLPECRVA